MRMSPEGGAKSTGVDQWMVAKGCAATDDTALCCAFPACVFHAASAGAGRPNDDAPRTRLVSEMTNARRCMRTNARRCVRWTRGAIGTPVRTGDVADE